MKVLHLAASLSAGGAELHLLTLCRHQRNLGVDVVVACLRDPVKGFRSIRSDFEQAGFRVIDLEADNRYDWRFVSRLIRLLKNERPDILHTHLPRADISGALAYKAAGIPAFICSVHGLYRDRWFGRWAGPLMAWAYRRADVVIAISHVVGTWLESDLRIPSVNIRVVYYGIELSQFSGEQSSAAMLSAVSGRMSLIGSIGRLEFGKGYEYLIKAMPAVVARYPQVEVLIAGHDPWGYSRQLETLIDDLSLHENVRLVGFQRDVNSFLRSLNVFAFTSRSEGFGQVLVEAMATGCPVVSWRMPPMTEIVSNEETGLLVESFDTHALSNALIELLDQPDRARRLGLAGQIRVKQYFDATMMTEKTVAIYENLLMQKR